MIELRDRQWLIDGQPRILFSGEIHYFRLARADWRSRLIALRDSGAHAVATYVPWIAHELPDGSIDVTGATADWRDVGAFCDLAADLGLYVIARPGPFVMAELKNEGLPHRVYRLPGVVPTSWGGAAVPTRDVDHLAPAFLSAVAQWYDAVIPPLASRQHGRGGPVIAVQLDNEVGMLAWVSNSPPLTLGVAGDWYEWLSAHDRLGRHPRLTGGADRETALAYLQAPTAAYARVVADDLMRFSRSRFRRYTDHLADLMTERGIDTVPFLVNVHGTGEGRGLTYPIGLSQLLGTWRGRADVAPGSDMYLGDITVANVADLVVGNVFARAVTGPDQPLTALEFEAGDGDYGEDLGASVPPEATGIRTRIAHGLGNRLMNFYLYAGGTNPPLERDPDRPEGDGIDRVSFTGEHHGFAAPIGPTGAPNRTHDALVEVVQALNGVEVEAASMEPHTDLTLGFVSDHYLTEYRVPDDAATSAIQDDLNRFRGLGPRQVLGRALVLGGFGLDGVDLCRHPELDTELTGGGGAVVDGARPSVLSVGAHPALAVASAHHLAADVQQRLADYLAAGGRLLLAGVLPTLDELGEPCRLLADALGVTVAGERGDHVVDEIGRRRQYYATVTATEEITTAAGLAARPDVRVGYAQLLSAGPRAVVLMRERASAQPCAVEVTAGAGRAVLLTTDYPCDLAVYTALLARLGVQPRYRTDATEPGLVVLGLRDSDGGAELVHLVNVAPYALTFGLWVDGAAQGRWSLPARRAELVTVRPRP